MIEILFYLYIGSALVNFINASAAWYCYGLMPEPDQLELKAIYHKLSIQKVAYCALMPVLNSVIAIMGTYIVVKSIPDFYHLYVKK
jgi:hypothetical protein